MVYEYPFWEEVLIEEDGLEILNITLNDLTEEDGLETLNITLTEIDNEIDGLESLDGLNFNLTEIVGLENLSEGNNTSNNKRKRFILID
jgi:hypothetical protein